MRKFVVLLVVVLLVGSAAPIATGEATTDRSTPPECDFPLTVKDATGAEITLEEPPERVVTTLPSAAQVMWEIGASDKVVGLTQFALYLDNASDRTLISENDEIVVLEIVVELEPDLVLAPNATDAETIDQMRDAGLTVYHFPLEEDLDDVFATTARIGELTGECAGAEETLSWMDEELRIVEDAIEGQERPGAMYLFFDFTAGSGTFIDEIITTAGGENLAASASIQGYQAVSDEVVVNESPDWLIVNDQDPAMPESDVLNETPAVQNDQIVTVEVEHLNQPAPRNILAIKTLVEHFHPEAYAEAKAAAEEADTDDTDGVADADDTDEADDADDTPAHADDADDVADDAAVVTTDDSDPIPGFGVIAAIVGLAILLASRRR